MPNPHRNRRPAIVLALLVLLLALAAGPAAGATCAAGHARAAHKKHHKKHHAKRAAHHRKHARKRHHKRRRPPHSPTSSRPATQHAAPATQSPAASAPEAQAARPAPAPVASDAIAPLTAVAPFPARARVFAAGSVWNQPLASDAPVDPASGQRVDALLCELHREMDTRAGPWINTSAWSVPVYTVGADVPLVHVTLDTSKPALQSDFAAVPIPNGAVPAVGTDAHMVVYQPSTDTMWEFYRARHVADGWHARWGGKMTAVSTASGIFSDGYGATGTSLPLLGGLMTINELRAGQIDHALALALPTTAAGTFSWPAQRSDGTTTGPSAIPEGTRFRLDPALDLDSLRLSPVALAMARAAQRYGIIVRDGASNITFYGEDPTPAGANPYPALFRDRYPNEVLAGFPWDHLEVVAPPS